MPELSGMVSATKEVGGRDRGTLTSQPHWPVSNWCGLEPTEVWVTAGG